MWYNVRMKKKIVSAFVAACCLLTGGVYAFPKENQLVSGKSIRFVRVPVYDSPCILTEGGVALR